MRQAAKTITLVAMCLLLACAKRPLDPNRLETTGIGRVITDGGLVSERRDMLVLFEPEPGCRAQVDMFIGYGDRGWFANGLLWKGGPARTTSGHFTSSLKPRHRQIGEIRWLGASEPGAFDPSVPIVLALENVFECPWGYEINGFAGCTQVNGLRIVYPVDQVQIMLRMGKRYKNFAPNPVCDAPPVFPGIGERMRDLHADLMEAYAPTPGDHSGSQRPGLSGSDDGTPAILPPPVHDPLDPAPQP